MGVDLADFRDDKRGHPESVTIPLRLAETLRRFRGTDHVAEQLESHILQSLANIVLLGDSGLEKQRRESD